MTKAIVAWPEKAHEIKNRVCDSTRWNGFAFRNDDIVIDTWSKAGTTWMQQIVAQLIFKGDADVFGAELSPWLDLRMIPLPAALAQLEAQAHRRQMKTHLPVGALVFNPRVKYIYLGRDVRDVIWSFYNHVANHTQEALDAYNALPDSGPLIEWPRGDVRQFYHDFLQDPNIAAASMWPFWEHVQGWWNIRGLSNVFLVHFNNLRADLPGEVRRIADYLDIPIDETVLPRIVEHCGFDHMQKVGARMEFLNMVFKEGAKTFFNKGTNGRWKDVLSAEEIAKADQIATQNLTPECAHWLRTGELPA